MFSIEHKLIETIFWQNFVLNFVNSFSKYLLQILRNLERTS